LTSKLKYAISALIILILIVVPVAAGCSRSGSSTTPPVVSTTAGNQTPPGGLSQRRTATGNIDSVNGNTLTLANPQTGKINVTISPSTVIEKSAIGQISDLKTGNYLTITGQQDNSGNIIAASLVFRASAPAGQFAPQNVSSVAVNPSATRPSGTPASTFSGTLVSSDNNILSLTPSQGPQIKVTVNPDTIIEKYESAVSADLQTGRSINVSGTADPGGNFTASSITIQATAKQVAAGPSPTTTAKPTTSNPGSSAANSTDTVIPVFSPSPVPTVPNIDGPPVILVIAPSASSTIAAGDMTVTILVTNFKLVQATGQANKAGEGHIIYYLDGAPLKMSAQPALSLTGSYAKSVITSYTWLDVKAGYHSLSVQLVNNDDTPLVPAITNTVYVVAR
jgi:hypothetical protein